jgi:hypothetical protein
MDKDCEMVASRLLDRWKGMRHPRHQLIANATMDEAFLQLGFTAALGSSTYSGVLKEVARELTYATPRNRCIVAKR